MSDEMKKHAAAVGTYIVKGALYALIALAVFIFNEMRDVVVETSKVVNEMSKVIERLDEKVTTDRNDINDLKSDVKNLERTKADK